MIRIIMIAGAWAHILKSTMCSGFFCEYGRALTFVNFTAGTDDMISKLVNKSELVPTSELLSTSKLVSASTSISRLASSSTAEVMRISKLVSTNHMMHTARTAPPSALAAGGVHGALDDAELETYAWLNSTEFEAYAGLFWLFIRSLLHVHGSTTLSSKHMQGLKQRGRKQRRGQWQKYQRQEEEEEEVEEEVVGGGGGGKEEEEEEEEEEDHRQCQVWGQACGGVTCQGCDRSSTT